MRTTSLPRASQRVECPTKFRPLAAGAYKLLFRATRGHVSTGKPRLARRHEEEAETQHRDKRQFATVPKKAKKRQTYILLAAYQVGSAGDEDNGTTMCCVTNDAKVLVGGMYRAV